MKVKLRRLEVARSKDPGFRSKERPGEGEGKEARPRQLGGVRRKRRVGRQSCGCAEKMEQIVDRLAQRHSPRFGGDGAFGERSKVCEGAGKLMKKLERKQLKSF